MRATIGPGLRAGQLRPPDRPNETCPPGMAAGGPARRGFVGRNKPRSKLAPTARAGVGRASPGGAAGRGFHADDFNHGLLEDERVFEGA